MARNTRRPKVALPGKSRSPYCAVAVGNAGCARLLGHKGSHRTTTQVVQAQRPKVADVIVVDGVKYRRIAERRYNTEGVEVHSADRYTVQAEPKVRKAAAKVARQLRCRVSRDGVRCGRAYGHKQAGQRHSFAAVVELAEVGPKGRDVQIVRGKPSRRRNFVASGRPSTLAR